MAVIKFAALFSLFTNATLAYSTFHMACYLPEASVNYVSGPPTRGSLDIFWAAMGTVIACTYTALHLNVPNPATKDWQIGLRYLTWSAITVLAPEIVLCKAIVDWKEARGCLLGLRMKLRGMRGASRHIPEWKLTHMMYANMNGIRYRQEHDVNSNGKVIDAETLCKAVEERCLSSKPPLSVPQIEDKSKAPLFVKVIAMGQLLYFCVTMVVRAMHHLPVTQLELAVTGFAACSIVTYGFTLNKPKAVTTPNVISVPVGVYDDLDIYRKVVRTDTGLSTFSMKNNPFKQDSHFTWAMLALVSIPFGAVHVAAWNFTFPTPIEMWLWRGAALASSAILPAEFVVVVVLYHVVDNYMPQNLNKLLLAGSLALTLGLYVLARVFLMVEMVRCMFFLPPGAFIGTWTGNLPHIGQCRSIVRGLPAFIARSLPHFYSLLTAPLLQTK